MPTTTLDEVKRYLWLYGTVTDTTTDPVDLLRRLLVEYEGLVESTTKSKPKRKP